LSVPFIHIVHFFGKALSWPVGFLAKLEVRTLKDRAIDNGTETSWLRISTSTSAAPYSLALLPVSACTACT